LHQGAVVATENLPLFNRRHHCCHSCTCGRAQSKDRGTHVR
jgi:hypothetical protein